MWECSVCNEVYSDDDSMTPTKIEAGVFMCQGCVENEQDGIYERLREEKYTGE